MFDRCKGCRRKFGYDFDGHSVNEYHFGNQPKWIVRIKGQKWYYCNDECVSKDFKKVRKTSDFNYNYITSEIVNWDLALQKSVWKKRLRGSLVFRNLLNKKHIYHPVGALFYLRFFVQVELDVHSLFTMN